MEFKYIVNEEQDGKPIRLILQERFHISARLLKRIRLHGNVFVNGQAKRMIDPAFSGDLIIARSAKNETELQPFYVNRPDNLEILFEDEHILVLNKPADCVVHPTFRHPENTLIDRLSEHPLHVVTRLDRETSGAILIAKHGYAHHRLTQKPIKKIYLALTHGIWQIREDLIKAAILRSPDSIMIRQVSPDGKEAVTRYRVKSENASHKISYVSSCI